MKLVRAGGMVFLLALASLCLGGHSMAAGQIAWYSFQDGMSAGKNQGKKSYLHFYADWCGYCKKMANETFMDPKVVEYLNTHFIAVKIDTNKDRKLADQFSVRGLPTNWFVDAKGESISSIPGYLPPDAFIKVLKFIHTDSYKTMSFSQFQEKM